MSRDVGDLRAPQPSEDEIAIQKEEGILLTFIFGIEFFFICATGCSFPLQIRIETLQVAQFTLYGKTFKSNCSRWNSFAD